jgi:hypothetical protein
MLERGRVAENLAELLCRGAPLGARSRLVGVRCVHCRREYLYDEVLDRLLLDPLEPRLACNATEDEIVPCQGCGRADWEFEDVSPDDATFFSGAWGYSFWHPRVTRSRGRVVKVAAAVTVGVLAILGALALAANPDPLSTRSVRPTLDLGW